MSFSPSYVHDTLLLLLFTLLHADCGLGIELNRGTILLGSRLLVLLFIPIFICLLSSALWTYSLMRRYDLLSFNLISFPSNQPYNFRKFSLHSSSLFFCFNLSLHSSSLFFFCFNLTCVISCFYLFILVLNI